MIHDLRYERSSQHFAPRERQHRQAEEQYKHIHLHLHLDLSFRSCQERFSSLSAGHLTRIFTALMAATGMYTWFEAIVEGGGPSTPLYAIAWNIILAGLALAWGAVVLGGLPLLVSAWRRSPRIRFLLVFLFIPLLITPILTFLGPQVGFWLSEIRAELPIPSALLLIFGLNRATRQAEIADTWLRFASKLSFVVVGAMILLLLGGFLWCLSLVLVAPMTYLWPAFPPFLGSVFPPFLGMCIAVLVAVYTVSWRPRSRESAEAGPKDDFPYAESEEV